MGGGEVVVGIEVAKTIVPARNSMGPGLRRLHYSSGGQRPTQLTPKEKALVDQDQEVGETFQHSAYKEPRDSPISMDTGNEKRISHSLAPAQYNNDEETSLYLNKGAADVTPGERGKLMYEWINVVVSLIIDSESPLLHANAAVKDHTLGTISKNSGPSICNSDEDRPAITTGPAINQPTRKDENLGCKGKRPIFASKLNLCRGFGKRPESVKKAG
ncbi:hypothetical protein Ancab_037418 [Ancistrocladus abbreviatus]